MAEYKFMLFMSLLITFSNTSGNIVYIRNLGGAVFWEGGGPIDLKCIISENRFSNVFWIKDNSTVWSLNDSFLIDLSPNHLVSQGVGRSMKKFVRLKIKTVQRKHSGSYKCLAEDPLMKEQIASEILIHVKYVPRQQYPQCLIEGDLPIPRLTCLSEPGSPEVVLEWKMPGENQTDLPSQKIIDRGMLKQVVDFRDVPAPSRPTIVSCLMFIEGYGALRSCDIDVNEMYNFNSSFGLYPSPTMEVSVRRNYNATCSTFLSNAHVMMTLQLPNRTKHDQVWEMKVEDGIVVHIENITEELEEAVISCQIDWGYLTGRTKVTHLRIKQVVNITRHPTQESVTSSPTSPSSSKTLTQVTQRHIVERVFDQVTESSSSESPRPVDDDTSSFSDQTFQTKSDGNGRFTDFRDFLLTSTTDKYARSMESDRYIHPATRRPSSLITSKMVSQGTKTSEPRRNNYIEDKKSSMSLVPRTVSPTSGHHFSLNGNSENTLYEALVTSLSTDRVGNFASGSEYGSSIGSISTEEQLKPKSPVESGNYIKPTLFHTTYFYLIIVGTIVSILVIYVAIMCIFGLVSSRKAKKTNLTSTLVT